MSDIPLIPLPGKWADELLEHMRTCADCKEAQESNSISRHCARGRELIRLTLEERHGE